MCKAKLEIETEVAYRVFEQTCSRWHLCETQKSSEPTKLSLHFILLLGMPTHRNSKGAHQHLSGELAQFLVRFTSDARHKGVISGPCRSMVEGIAADEEDFGQLFIIIGHHSRTRRLLGHRQQVMDVLDGAECFLPEFELD